MACCTALEFSKVPLARQNELWTSIEAHLSLLNIKDVWATVIPGLDLPVLKTRLRQSLRSLSPHRRIKPLRPSEDTPLAHRLPAPDVLKQPSYQHFSFRLRTRSQPWAAPLTSGRTPSPRPMPTSRTRRQCTRRLLAREDSPSPSDRQVSTRHGRSSTCRARHSGMLHSVRCSYRRPH